MSGRVFALLVGINDYPANVGKLSGCVNDVQHVKDFLKQRFAGRDLRIETLLNSDATRTNVIEQFQMHLSQARADDVAIFHYSGHGAQSRSAEPFRQFYPSGKDEGLVCVDSRQPGSFDLADKELAVLLSEVAINNPHLAVFLDCCHSGSATRGVDDFMQLRARQTHEVFDPRPLESYLDGYYSRQSSFGIPTSRHILLAACERFQKAWEGRDHTGVFTSTFLEVLGKSEPDLSYADLFVRCRAVVRRRADNQNPQFETYGGFKGNSGFLGGPGHSSGRYSVSFTNNSWSVDCGAIHGLPTDPDKRVELELYSDTRGEQSLGRAVASKVGAQKSELELYFEADPLTHYRAEITGLPVSPLAVASDGDTEAISAFRQSVASLADQSAGSAFVDDPTGARYVLSAEQGGYFLRQADTGRTIQGARCSAQQAAEYLCPVIKQVATWERTSKLQNNATRMDLRDVQFLFREVLADGHTFDHPGEQVTVDYRQQNGKWADITGQIMVDNRSAQTLHMALLVFSEDYEIQTPYNEPVEQTDSLITLPLGDDGSVNFFLDEDEDEQTYHFKLIVSTEKVDAFLLEKDPLTIGKVFTSREPPALKNSRGMRLGKKMVHENEWFTKDLFIKVVRRQDRLTTSDTALAGNKITIKGHPSLQADVRLCPARTATRSLGDSNDVCRILTDRGLEIVDFVGTRGEGESVLELTDIRNPEVLADQPLEIELDVPVEEGWGILPLAFDGEDILVVGDPSIGDDQRTRISIREIPNIPDHRRSLGRALKLYFFKAYLGVKQLNELCWIEYKEDGKFERHRLGVADRVAKAKNIILLIHGIIGNTDSIVEGLRLAKDADGRTVDQKFDLVLTYDYENLSTSIVSTALDLKKQLAAVGLKEGDGRRLTLVVHSMGGLVSRWFIERDGGNKVVDHLVMFGTPNAGSPFGKVDSARQLGGFLTTLAINALPALVPYGGALVYALNRSKNVTPTLEQMNPDSEFIAQLNESPDPGIPYTVIAGDIRDYDPSQDAIVGRLLAKVAKGFLFETLYQNLGHDIAVSSDSIRQVAEARVPVPVKRTAVCHHLNYFSSPAGLAAMVDVSW